MPRAFAAPLCNPPIVCRLPSPVITPLGPLSAYIRITCLVSPAAMRMRSRSPAPEQDQSQIGTPRPAWEACRVSREMNTELNTYSAGCDAARAWRSTLRGRPTFFLGATSSSSKSHNRLAFHRAQRLHLLLAIPLALLSRRRCDWLGLAQDLRFPYGSIGRLSSRLVLFVLRLVSNLLLDRRS